MRDTPKNVLNENVLYKLLRKTADESGCALNLDGVNISTYEDFDGSVVITHRDQEKNIQYNYKISRMIIDTAENSQFIFKEISYKMRIFLDEYIKRLAEIASQRQTYRPQYEPQWGVLYPETGQSFKPFPFASLNSTNSISDRPQIMSGEVSYSQSTTATTSGETSISKKTVADAIEKDLNLRKDGTARRKVRMD